MFFVNPPKYLLGMFIPLKFVRSLQSFPKVSKYIFLFFVSVVNNYVDTVPAQSTTEPAFYLVNDLCQHHVNVVDQQMSISARVPVVNDYVETQFLKISYYNLCYFYIWLVFLFFQSKLIYRVFWQSVTTLTPCWRSQQLWIHMFFYFFRAYLCQN